MKVCRSIIAGGLVVAANLAGMTAMAQSSCSSDGVVPPAVLIERFIDAECADCWRDPDTVRPKSSELAIDWILPSPRGEEAALFAVATNDAAQRLEHLPKIHRSPSFSHRSVVLQSRLVARPLPRLRVARGIALGGYMGASIELTAKSSASRRRLPLAYPLKAWLTLVEEVPEGTEGSPVKRLLVRNTLVAIWTNGQRTLESRPMSLPAGSNPEKMRVVGWVEDRNGHLVASAVSQCR